MKAFEAELAKKRVEDALADYAQSIADAEAWYRDWKARQRPAEPRTFDDDAIRL